jgi:hypothetical protein
MSAPGSYALINPTLWRSHEPDAPVPDKGFFITHFLTVRDQATSREFLRWDPWRKSRGSGESHYIKLVNSGIILNAGEGPTPDKPEVLLESPRNLNTVNSFLNLRVADIQAIQGMEGEGSSLLD